MNVTSKGDLLWDSGRQATKPASQNAIRWIVFSNETLGQTGLLTTWTRFGYNWHLAETVFPKARLQTLGLGVGREGCSEYASISGRNTLGPEQLGRHHYTPLLGTHMNNSMWKVPSVWDWGLLSRDRVWQHACDHRGNTVLSEMLRTCRGCAAVGSASTTPREPGFPSQGVHSSCFKTCDSMSLKSCSPCVTTTFKVTSQFIRLTFGREITV